MTYEDIVKANATIKTTDIKGKDYAEVNQRIKAFRMVYPRGFIHTEMLSNENGVCVFSAEVGYYNEENVAMVLGTGTAREDEKSSFINKTSYIENCETSAVGRALGMCGFGIDTSIASYEEVANAVNQQEEKPTKDNIETLRALAKEKGVSEEKLLAKYKIKDFGEMKMTDYLTCFQGLNKMVKK
jgi:hypothetical protein